VKIKPPVHWIVVLLSVLPVASCLAALAPGTRLSFRVLSTRTEMAPPFAAVDFIYGPKEEVAHANSGLPKWGLWWQLEIRTNTDGATAPRCVVRGLTATDPLAGREKPRFGRYQLRVPETGEALEYVDRHFGLALLPPWVDFERWFIPSPTFALLKAAGWERELKRLKTSHKLDVEPIDMLHERTCMYLNVKSTVSATASRPNLFGTLPAVARSHAKSCWGRRHPHPSRIWAPRARWARAASATWGP